MKLKMIAALFAAVLPLSASADTGVQLYGIVDLAMAREDADAPGVASRTAMHAGRDSSRFGLRGTEDLGNGLTAMFNVEGGFDASTGVGDSALFGRRAVVGLQGSFGELTAGREYTPLDNVSGASTTMGQGFYGSNLNAFSQGGMTRRISNSVNYKSKATSGFRVSLAYGAGETATGQPSNDYIGYGLEYKNGPLFVAAAAGETERAAGRDKEYIVGAAYKLGVAEVKGNYMVHNRASDSNTFTQVNLGVAFPVTAAGTVLFSVQQSEFDNGGEGRGFAVAYTHNLSKRTFVYGSFGHLSNNGQATFALASAGSSVTPPATAFGADPRALAIGLRHAF
ncbi:porin [Pseudoduganella sp. GCM10020061]|uniref:porin n=1 Tax=Pseudoduganella sp. GCM10020061 TaxID=3317345 RepID=UPI00362F43EE